MRHVLTFIACFLLALAPNLSSAEEEPVYKLTLQNHQFLPATLELPPNVKVKLRVKNLDSTAEEFESYRLKREKIVPEGSEVIVYIGPLSPGTYEFWGDFHRETTRGQIIVREK